jgi:SAM-dependent methyltransferase
MNAYRRRIRATLDELLKPLAPVPTALDFGSGDGWFADQFQSRGLVKDVVPVDVQLRDKTVRPPQLYDGTRLPFADRSFDLVYSIDVLHHCPDPVASLRDLLRCGRSYFLIKDHTYRGSFGYFTLCALDEIGNRRFGIPSRYKYQREWDWRPVIEEAGYEAVRLIHPAPCHRGPLGWATNRLQFIGLWRRTRT